MASDQGVAARSPDRWLVARRGPDAADLSLFCLPYAGGSAAIFNAWSTELPRWVGLYAVEFPGRGRRFRERPLTRMEPLVAGLADAVAPLLDRPFALFGHSMGAIVAFELARELRRRGAGTPLRLVVAGSNPPGRQRRLWARPLHTLPEREFLALLERLGGTPQEVLADPQLMRLVSRVIRADLEALETYRYTEQERLTCPILAFGGSHDRVVHPSSLRHWSAETTGAFDSAVFPGDHFFLHRERERLLAQLTRELRAARREAPARASPRATEGEPLGARA